MYVLLSGMISALTPESPLSTPSPRVLSLRLKHTLHRSKSHELHLNQNR